MIVQVVTIPADKLRIQRLGYLHVLGVEVIEVDAHYINDIHRIGTVACCTVTNGLVRPWTDHQLLKIAVRWAQILAHVAPALCLSVNENIPPSYKVIARGLHVLPTNSIAVSARNAAKTKETFRIAVFRVFHHKSTVDALSFRNSLAIRVYHCAANVHVRAAR